MTSLSAMQSLGGFHSMAAAAHLRAYSAVASAGVSSHREMDGQTDLSSVGHHLGATLPPHEYHHL